MNEVRGKAVFLDRDGVINRERGDYTWLLEDFVINEGVMEALREIQARGFRLFVISNQGGIAKGLYTKEQADYLHLHLRRVMENNGVLLEEIYYCPHHPSVTNCLCRKPGSLMIEKAVARFHLDASRCVFIGDAERDAEAAKGAGVRGIVIPPNSDLRVVSALVE